MSGNLKLKVVLWKYYIMFFFLHNNFSFSSISTFCLLFQWCQRFCCPYLSNSKCNLVKFSPLTSVTVHRSVDRRLVAEETNNQELDCSVSPHMHAGYWLRVKGITGVLLFSANRCLLCERYSHMHTVKVLWSHTVPFCLFIVLNSLW